MKQRLANLNALIANSSANEDLLREQMSKFQGKSSDIEGQLSELSKDNQTKELELKRLQEEKELEIRRLQQEKDLEAKRLQQEHSNLSSEMQKVMADNEQKVEQLLKSIANNESSLGGKNRVLMEMQEKIEEFEAIISQKTDTEK